MMSLIKTHLITLVSGVVILACFGLAGWFMSSTAVEAAMEQARRDTGANSISGLMKDPKNKEIIKAAEDRGNAFDAEFGKTVAKAREINERQPLMENVFPVAESAAIRSKYAEEYKRVVTRQLAADLKAGQLPDPVEIAEEQQNVDDLWDLLVERRIEEGGEDDGGRQPTAVATANPRSGASPYDSGGMRDPGGGGMRSPSGGGMRSPSGGGMRSPSGAMGAAYSPTAADRSSTGSAAPSGEPKFNEVYRARVSKARSIRCYIDDPRVTFHVSPIVDATSSPLPQDMWFAQVGLWIQQDIVKAIADLNEQAVAGVTGGDTHVEHVPIKRLMAIYVFGYDLGAGSEIPFAWFDRVGAAGGGPAPGVSFSQRQSGALYDIVRFQISVVIDQREILQLIDALSRVNFYLCTGMSYEAVNRAIDQDVEGYFYGTAPVVRATYDFEGYMLRDAYQKWMPPAVLELLGIEKKKGD